MKSIINYISVYGYFGFCRLAMDALLTKLDNIWFNSNIRLIRRPVYIRGRKHISIGDGFTSGVGLRLDAFPIVDNTCIKIGRNVEVNDYVHIGAIKSVTIGDNVLIASKVYISDHNHGHYGTDNLHDSPESIPKERELSYAPVVVDNNVWIGESVSIMPGVTIGTGSIIGASAVVTRSVPPYCIAVGSPAKVIKKYNFVTATWELV
jgi:acetyltransferase-like isoleucine patch superfamily enzyme